MEVLYLTILLGVLVTPTFATTACVATLHGVCVSLYATTVYCPIGDSFTVSFCGFMQGCCYPTYTTSGIHGSTGTQGSTGTHGSTSGSQIGSGTPGALSGSGSRSTTKCGMSEVPHTKIVGGTVATPGEYPWQVSLRFNGQHMCGGTLISNQWVLTATHCFEDTGRSHWTVATGVHDRGHIYTTQVHRAVNVISHQGYDKTTHHNDATLVKLEKPIDITSTNVRIACLPEPHQVFDNQICTATGWGTTYLGGQTTRYLEEIDLPIIANSQCRYIMGNAVTSSNICAGYTRGHGVCKGDSGGPLICKVNNHWTLAGITSWGYGCAEAHTPGVYTRASAFLDWIHTTMRLH
ncbi:Transmembrane protease serine 2 [Mizuhopecten yessoensis]|uniref:Transmembrane protease serine 2 n=3 Tax=Mizuhopecten yessoensis TaxID=6573 RepID=A0A210QXJ1_MIZYE|nr:Transmembrane protease serine 2 [Mizuhopecten yessoensis]